MPEWVMCSAIDSSSDPARSTWAAAAVLSLAPLQPSPLPKALQDIAERFTLQPLLAAPVDRALGRSYTIQQGIDALVVAAGRDQVYPGGGLRCGLVPSLGVCAHVIDMHALPRKLLVPRTAVARMAAHRLQPNPAHVVLARRNGCCQRPLFRPACSVPVCQAVCVLPRPGHGWQPVAG